jgi:hypothetical protein
VADTTRAPLHHDGGDRAQENGRTFAALERAACPAVDVPTAAVLTILATLSATLSVSSSAARRCRDEDQRRTRQLRVW